MIEEKSNDTPARSPSKEIAMKNLIDGFDVSDIHTNNKPSDLKKKKSKVSCCDLNKAEICRTKL